MTFHTSGVVFMKKKPSDFLPKIERTEELITLKQIFKDKEKKNENIAEYCCKTSEVTRNAPLKFQKLCLESKTSCQKLKSSFCKEDMR